MVVDFLVGAGSNSGIAEFPHSQKEKQIKKAVFLVGKTAFFMYFLYAYIPKRKVGVPKHP